MACSSSRTLLTLGYLFFWKKKFVRDFQRFETPLERRQRARTRSHLTRRPAGGRLNPSDNPRRVSAAEGPLMISQLGRGPAVAPSSPGVRARESPALSAAIVVPKPSVNYPEAAPLSRTPTPTTSSLQPPILSLNYLDQWALKDPGKDKHSIWRRGCKMEGVFFQTELKSPPNCLRAGDKRWEPFSRQCRHTRCLFSSSSAQTRLICVAFPDRSPEMISFNLCLSVVSVTSATTATTHTHTQWERHQDWRATCF